jgi:hypothetical protein
MSHDQIISQKINNFNIILTVPHSVPIENYSKRSHDISALNMANRLKRLCEKYGMAVHLIESAQNRTVLDDNRYSDNNHCNKMHKTNSSNSGNLLNIRSDSLLWKKLREIFNNINYKRLIIIDCHSFYKGGFDIDPSIEMVLLDYTPYQHLVKQISLEAKKSIPNMILSGTIGCNSILDVMTSHPHYVPTILLEVREDLSDERLEQIAIQLTHTLVGWIKHWDNKKKWDELNN